MKTEEEEEISRKVAKAAKLETEDLRYLDFFLIQFSSRPLRLGEKPLLLATQKRLSQSRKAAKIETGNSRL